ncbi:uncharacterized protein L201_001739 [Kwoniella dendrophila CBS 6074]|uniref:Uncharacterized protein n=1 Tax=Kwoniella dendrophila CBS 6074 TaxID=1295534 RepID=A0AAX4JN65_9TREE
MPGGTPVIEEIYNNKGKILDALDDKEKVLIEQRYIKLPLSKSDLESWSKICQLTLIWFGKFPYLRDQKEAVFKFQTRLVELSIPPQQFIRLNDKDIEAKFIAKVANRFYKKLDKINEKLEKLEIKVDGTDDHIKPEAKPLSDTSADK